MARVVFVDVDDTLVRSVGSKRIPMTSVVAHVRELHASGHVLYLWSSGGAEYARKSAEELELAECFAGFLPTLAVPSTPGRVRRSLSLLSASPASFPLWRCRVRPEECGGA